MSGQPSPWQQIEYEGFELHVQCRQPDADISRYTYFGYVCHPGADPTIPGHIVPFQADGEATFASEHDAMLEALQVARSIVDGTHPDLSVLSLVTHGF